MIAVYQVCGKRATTVDLQTDCQLVCPVSAFACEQTRTLGSFGQASVRIRPKIQRNFELASGAPRAYDSSAVPNRSEGECHRHLAGSPGALGGGVEVTYTPGEPTFATRNL